jgi:sugar lactone lactonase YvrE
MPRKNFFTALPRLLGIVVLGLIGYFLLWPVPIEPVKWAASPAPPYEGAFSVNHRLGSAKLGSLGEYRKPEHILVGPDGKLYTGVEGGKILRMNPDLTGLEVFADTGGRVLGFGFDARGNFIGADAMRGLVSVTPDGKITLLLTQVNGGKIQYADGLAIAKDGKIYVTDATTRFPASKWGISFGNMLDMLEQSATGRVIEFDPATGSARIVAHGFAFANGIVVSEDQSSLFVAETARYRIWKVSRAATDLDVGKPTAQATVLFDNLPGFPDNLTRGLDGRIWLGFAAPRVPLMDESSPFLRKISLRLPRSLMPKPRRYGHVIAFTEDGKIAADLQDPSGGVAVTTGLTETRDRLYVQTIEDVLGIPWVPSSRLSEH